MTGAQDNCPYCGHANGRDQRFCGSCGRPFFVECDSCGRESALGLRFCGGCGASLERKPPISASLEGERRWATVLFGDLAGFTRFSEAADPEEIRLVVDRCTSRMGEVVYRYGGWVDKVIGDSVMAVFGAPVAHEDDAERAVRAALDLQTYAAENSDELAGLGLRVGIDSGEVIFAPVGPDGRREVTVMGNTVNTASRLQEVAPRGGVLIGGETERACRETIRCERMEPIALKGKAAMVHAWLAREAIPPPADEATPTAPLVGRKREFDLLRDTWERVVDVRQPHLLSLLGSPGIGKTRLCRELISQVETGGGWVVRGRSLPYGESTGYGAFAQMIRSIAEVGEADPPNEIRAKIGRRVEGLVDASDRESAVAHLGLLAGLSEDPVDERSVLFTTARDFIEGLAQEQATLFVFEDIHWADPSLLDLIESAAVHVRDVPAMFLTIARGELLDARPNWGGGIPCHTGISLEPLPPESGRELALRSLRDVPQPEIAAEQIERAADGNPLFVEELAAAMAEGVTDPSHVLPVAVRTIIAARLDALPADERRLLLDAAVAGNVFTRDVLECLGGDELFVSEALEDLEFRDLIRRPHGARVRDGEAFRFKHALIREVAYGMLPQGARQDRHARIAGYMEEATGPPDHAAILAHHWREAGDSERAVRYLLSAAEQAGLGWATAESIDLYNQALALIPEGDESHRRDVELKRAMAYAAFTHTADARRVGRE